MDRALQLTALTAPVTYYEDGVVVDPGTVTVGITREDGTVLVAAGTATGGTGAAARTFALTTTHMTSLDLLKLSWTSATKGTLVTYIEVVGGFLATVAEIRAESPLSNATTYPTASILTARTTAEQALEDACGVAFVPRYARETRNGNGSTDLLPNHPKPISVTTLTLDGTTETDAVVDTERGTFYRESGWGTTRQGVVVKYAHGYQFPPANCSKVIAKLTKWLLVDSPLNDRATNIVSDEGTQFLITAGVRNAVFSIPDANSFIAEYGVRVNVW
jgi:hypothetical protein